MNNEENKVLAEFAGLCTHTEATIKRDNDGWADWYCISCGKYMYQTKFDNGTPKPYQRRQSDRPPDFTTCCGYQLLHDKISERGEWELFYKWYLQPWRDDLIWFKSATFHELPPAEKPKLIYEALQAGAIGG